MIRALSLSALIGFAALPAWADARVSVLLDALRLSDVVQIMREEGLEYADDLNADILGGQGGTLWQAQVDGIYNAERMQETVRAAVEKGLQPDDIAAATAFFATDRGERIVAMENAAREAMQDEAVEEAARDLFENLASDNDSTVDFIRTFVAANDLMDRNVSGAMSSNFQFYQGMVDGRLMDMSESDIAQDVWAQEPEIRAETENWLFAYLTLAFEPLAPEDVEAYVAFSQSHAGKTLNAALFEGYEAMYRDISYALGRAVALGAAGNDI